jgi:DNA-directed RNA polymerase subunit RPC12/RpoP
MNCDQENCGGRGAMARFRLMTSGRAIACPKCGEMIAISGAVQALVAILLLLGFGLLIVAYAFAVLSLGLGTLAVAVCLWFIAPVSKISGQQLGWRKIIELSVASLMVVGVLLLVAYTTWIR